MNSGLTSHQQRGHTETGPRFEVSSERPEKRGIDLATPGLVVQRVIHYTTAAPDEAFQTEFFFSRKEFAPRGDRGCGGGGVKLFPFRVDFH